LFSLALAVGLTPQLLPAIVTVTLAHGAREMARRKVIVKRPSVGLLGVLAAVTATYVLVTEIVKRRRTDPIATLSAQPRTTTTGQGAWSATCRATEPTRK
jgi:hypothetical protein